MICALDLREEIDKIHDLFDTPDPSVFIKLKTPASSFFNVKFTHKKGSGPEILLPNVSPQAVHLLYLLCKYDPVQRLTASQALADAFCNGMESDECAAGTSTGNKTNHKELGQQTSKG